MVSRVYIHAKVVFTNICLKMLLVWILLSVVFLVTGVEGKIVSLLYIVSYFLWGKHTGQEN